jgi:hypothetical protein
MIAPNKLQNALRALHGVLIVARQMAYTKAPGAAMADILDSVEILPSLIASEMDETDQFRLYLASIAEKHKCVFVLQYFDEPVPPNWAGIRSRGDSEV